MNVVMHGDKWEEVTYMHTYLYTGAMMTEEDVSVSFPEDDTTADDDLIVFCCDEKLLPLAEGL